MPTYMPTYMPNYMPNYVPNYEPTKGFPVVALSCLMFILFVSLSTLFLICLMPSVLVNLWDYRSLRELLKVEVEVLLVWKYVVVLNVLV